MDNAITLSLPLETSSPGAKKQQLSSFEGVQLGMVQGLTAPDTHIYIYNMYTYIYIYIYMYDMYKYKYIYT